MTNLIPKLTIIAPVLLALYHVLRGEWAHVPLALLVALGVAVCWWVVRELSGTT